MIQDGDLIADRHAGGLKILDRVCNAAIGHIASGIVVPALNQESRMRAPNCNDKEMKFLKVLIIARDNCQVVADGERELDRVGSMEQSSVSGDNNRVPR